MICSHFLASLAALIAAFSSSVFSSAGASVDINRVLRCWCLVAIGITLFLDVGAFRKAVATDGPKFPTARRTAPAEEMKRSIGVVETIDLPAGVEISMTRVYDSAVCRLAIYYVGQQNKKQIRNGGK